jgi:hypothetical protein
MAAAVRQVGERAAGHMREARRLAHGLPRRAVPALLPMSFAARDLASLRGTGWNPFGPVLGRHGGGRQLAVLWRAFLGRI